MIIANFTLTFHLNTLTLLHFRRFDSDDSYCRIEGQRRRNKRIIKALKREVKSFEKGDSKVTGRQKDRRKMGMGKRGFWIALNSLIGEEIFQRG